VNALDFSKNGELLVTSGDDESVHLYDISAGSLRKALNARKYGVTLVRFTHDPSAVICASGSATTWDHSLRYWSLHDNRYLRYFMGHRDTVVSLAMSPLDDTFFSGSLDSTVRLWDLRTDSCQGLLRVSGQPSIAFDNTGSVMACASESDKMQLLDMRVLDKGPFLTFRFTDPLTQGATCLQFSNDGAHILVCSRVSDGLYLIDAFDGSLVTTWRVPGVSGWREAAFSPDALYVAAGGNDGKIYIWSHTQLSEKPVTVLGHQGDGHPFSVSAVRWNPTKCMLASGCRALVWWIPREDPMQE